MRTNIHIETTDEERSLLANLIDGKEKKRLASRAEIVELCQLHIAALINQSNAATFKTIADTSGVPEAQEVNPDGVSWKKHPWYTPDPEDAALLHGKDPEYIFGWNKGKHQPRNKS